MSFTSENACSCFNSKSWKLYFGREAPTWQNNSNDKIFQGVFSPLQSRQVNIDFWFESYKSCTNTDLKTPAESKWEDILVTISSRIRWLMNKNLWSKTILLKHVYFWVVFTLLSLSAVDSKVAKRTKVLSNAFEGGYSKNPHQTQKKKVFLSWKDFRWYFPNPRFQLVRGLHILTTPAGQSSGFYKKWVKK